MANTVGALIKEARTKAKLTQEQLANMVDGLTASDISKAERGEKELTQAALKQIAKATGVTQASLLNAAKADAEEEAKVASKSSKSGSTKSASAKSGSSKSSSAKSSSSSKSGTKSTSTKKTTEKKDEFTLTATEKKLVELYRAADSDTKKRVTSILKGEEEEPGDILSSLLGNAMDMFTKAK